MEMQEYYSQLAKVQNVISTLSDGPEKDELLALEADLLEIISLHLSVTDETSDVNNDDALSEEYNLFKAELSKLESEETESVSSPKPGTSYSDSNGVELLNKLNSLKGTKCQAPFMYKWANKVTYHNAFVSHIPEVIDKNNVEVKVFFTNPTHDEMKPCPYYLEGECKFSDDRCKFSHGELVLLSSLKDYREPDFSKIRKKRKALAKREDGLWHRAIVLNAGDEECKVKFESNSKIETIPLHNLLPLRTDLKSDESSSEDESDPNVKSDEEEEEEAVRKILPGSCPGDWERFTKGFGSRMLNKMGYVPGSGLGKEGKGILEPIPTIVIPAGISLDHCMKLKERAGDGNLFNLDRKLKLQQEKRERKQKKAYELAKAREKERQKGDVFNLMNTVLFKGPEKSTSVVEEQKPLKKESGRSLNIKRLHLAESVSKLQKEIQMLNKSLLRNDDDVGFSNQIRERLKLKTDELAQLQVSEKRVKDEEDQRREIKKLTTF